MPSVTSPLCNDLACLQRTVAGIRGHSAAAYLVIVHDGDGAAPRRAHRHRDRRWGCHG